MPWFVAATKPNAESTAKAHLKRQGFTVLLPCFLKKRRHARRIDTVHQSLFPGYIFIELNPDQVAWRAINGTIGIKHLLTNGGIPQVVLPHFMHNLLSQIDENELVETIESPFNIGNQVEVRQGPFSGQIAKIIDCTNEDRIKILMSFMGQDVVSTIPADKINLAS